MEDVDVKIDDLPMLKVDAKYRKAHSHHRFMEEILDKYCKEDGDVPVLVTKEHRQTGCFVTVPGWYFEFLLGLARCLRPLKPAPAAEPINAKDGGPR